MAGLMRRRLARKLGIDAETCAKTLEGFNRFAAGELDPDLHRGIHPWTAEMTGDPSRPNPSLGPVCTAPFCGLALTAVGVGIKAVGLETDTRARVMHVRGRPIPGLDAVGSSAALPDTGASEPLDTEQWRSLRKVGRHRILRRHPA